MPALQESSRRVNFDWVKSEFHRAYGLIELRGLSFKIDSVPIQRSLNHFQNRWDCKLKASLLQKKRDYLTHVSFEAVILKKGRFYDQGNRAAVFFSCRWCFGNGTLGVPKHNVPWGSITGFRPQPPCALPLPGPGRPIRSSIDPTGR